MMNQDHAANVAAKVLPGVPPSNWRRTALDAAPRRTDSAVSAPSVRPSPWSMDGRRQNAVVRRACLGRSDKFSQVLSKGAIEQYWGNRPHQREIMEWRWDNGLAFMDYKERVLTYLSDVILLNNEAEVTLAIKKIYGIQTAISLLREDFTTLVNTDLLKQFHPTTRGVIKGFANGRISLDKMAKDADQAIYDRKSDLMQQELDKFLDNDTTNNWIDI